jgi:photosystem II stability/assembly factor-like uncharacterized protein
LFDRIVHFNSRYSARADRSPSRRQKTRRLSCCAAAGVAIAIITALAAPAEAASTWTKTGPIAGAYVAGVAYSADGSVLYAGGIGAVFRSTDGGASWTASALPAGFASSLVVDVATSPLNKNFALASTWDISLPTGFSSQYGPAGDAVFFTSNAGQTWTLGAGLSNQVGADDTQYPYYPAWDPKTAETAYAAAGGGEAGVFRTTNGGKNWSMVYQQTDISQPVPIGPIAAVATKPVSLYLAADDYSGDGDEFIAKSTNGGLSFSFDWPLNYVGFPGYGPVFTAFGADPKNPLVVYTLASGYQANTLVTQQSLQFQWTPNGGVNWVNRVSGLPKSVTASALAVDPASGKVLMPLCCANHNELYVSTNQGKSWSAGGAIPAGPTSLAVRPGLAASRPATLAAAGPGGVLVSTNGGTSWAGDNTGLDQPNITDVVADPTKTTVLYVGTKAGVLRSSNGGNSFVAINKGLTDLNIQALALDPTAAGHVLYAAAASGVYRCENPDGGTPVWTAITPPGAVGRLGTFGLAVNGVTAGRIYVSTNPLFASREIYRSDDYGAQWIVTGFNAATGNDLPGPMIADPKSPDTLYATAQSSAGIYKSTNAGKSFTEIYGAGGRFLWGQGSSLNPRTLYVVGTSTSGRDAGQATIFRSTDGGRTWDTDANAAPGGGKLLRLAADPLSSEIYALVRITQTGFESQQYVLAIYESPNRGITWTNVVGNLGTLCRPCGVGLNGGFTVPAVTRDPTLWATGNTLAFAAPLAASLFIQHLH